MKRTTLLITALLLFAAGARSQQPTTLIGEVLKESAQQKVAGMQELIGFDDTQAKQLFELEYRFLLDVQKAENCFLCNKKKRIEKLKQQRDKGLQEVLNQLHYIQYDAIDNKRIDKHPLWSE